MSQFWMSIFGAKFKCINRAYEISVQNIGQSLKIQYSVSKNSWISIFFLISLILLTLKPIKINRKMNFDHSSLQTYPESTWGWGTFHILAQYLKFVKVRLQSVNNLAWSSRMMSGWFMPQFGGKYARSVIDCSFTNR